MTPLPTTLLQTPFSLADLLLWKEKRKKGTRLLTQVNDVQQGPEMNDHHHHSAGAQEKAPVDSSIKRTSMFCNNVSRCRRLRNIAVVPVLLTGTTSNIHLVDDSPPFLPCSGTPAHALSGMTESNVPVMPPSPASHEYAFLGVI
jgi:hypothetical protein